jgi:hypothetical protein
MKKQKVQMAVMLVLIAVCVLGYFLLNRYTQKKEEEQQAEADAAETVVCQIATEDVTAFSYQTDGATYSYRKNGEEWVCEGYEDIDLDEDEITTLLSDAAEITCDEVVTDVEDYTAFGFETPANVITITTAEKTITITIGDYNSTADCYYYMTSESDDVYAGNAYVCTSFMQLPEYYQVTESETEVSENATN